MVAAARKETVSVAPAASDLVWTPPVDSSLLVEPVVPVLSQAADVGESTSPVATFVEDSDASPTAPSAPASSVWPDLGVACEATPSDLGRRETSGSLDLVNAVTSDLGLSVGSFGRWDCKLYLLIIWSFVADSSVPSCGSGVSSNWMISLPCMFPFHSCWKYWMLLDQSNYGSILYTRCSLISILWHPRWT